jgi:hypothetical protein
MPDTSALATASADDVVSSRMALLRGLETHPELKWGMAAQPKFGREELPEGAHFLEDDAPPMPAPKAS